MMPASHNKKVQQLFPKPKNGRWFVVLMVGAPSDRARELRDRLAQTRGILVQYHFDYEKPNQFKIHRIPECVDFVIFIKSQLGHPPEARVLNAIKAWPREHGGEKMPYIKTSHKWSNLDQVLRSRFNLSKAEPLPIEVTSTAYFKAPKEWTEEPVVETVQETVVEAAPVKTPEVVIDLPVSASHRQVSAETVALALQLQKRLIDENFIAMISPTELTLSYAGAKP